MTQSYSQTVKQINLHKKDLQLFKMIVWCFIIGSNISFLILSHYSSEVSLLRSTLGIVISNLMFFLGMKGLIHIFNGEINRLNKELEKNPHLHHQYLESLQMMEPIKKSVAHSNYIVKHHTINKLEIVFNLENGVLIYIQDALGVDLRLIDQNKNICLYPENHELNHLIKELVKSLQLSPSASISEREILSSRDKASLEVLETLNNIEDNEENEQKIKPIKSSKSTN